MHSTHLRGEHIHGALLGAAMGEALGRARNSLSRRTALAMFGRPPLGYAFIPKRGCYGDDTRLTLLNAQALLNSRGDSRSFRRAFVARLKWTAFSLAVDTRKTTFTAAARAWLNRFGVKSGVYASDPGACPRAIFSTLAIHGTGHRLHKWVEESTRLTHTHPQAIDGCRVLATLANYASSHKTGQFDALAALESAIETATGQELTTRLEQIREPLQQRRSPTFVARHLAWDTAIPEETLPVTVISAYCWLRYPNNFRRAVESAICLGGASASLGCVVGGLVGAHLGQAQLSRRMRKQLNSGPHDPEWLEALANRFSHWPHGADDLHLAPALPSHVISQMVRNISTCPVSLLHGIYRIPYRNFPRRLPKRMRR